MTFEVRPILRRSQVVTQNTSAMTQNNSALTYEHFCPEYRVLLPRLLRKSNQMLRAKVPKAMSNFGQSVGFLLIVSILTHFSTFYPQKLLKRCR